MNIPFEINFNYLFAFTKFKKCLITTPIIISPQCSLNFELLCDASDYAIIEIIGQILDKKFYFKPKPQLK